MNGPSQREASDRARWALAGALLVLGVAVAIGLDALGRGARVTGTARGAGGADVDVILVRTGRDAVAAWRARGLRGRVLVHAGRYLHFVSEANARLVSETLTAPGRGAALDAALAANAGPLDYLWVTATTGLARRIVYYPPPDALADRLEALALDRAALPAALPSETFPRVLAGELPALREPVVVEVHASWFERAPPAALLEALRASGLRADLVTLNLAEDAADVGEGARQALRAFGAALAGRPLEPSP